MVILKNIKKTDDTISADYYPEGKEPRGYMEIDLKSGVVIGHNNVSSFAASHVRRELKRLGERDELPREKTVLWY